MTHPTEDQKKAALTNTKEIDMTKGMIVLSLFDGMSCGQVALKRIGAKVDKYYASEIDHHAIKVTMKNHPETIQLGTVTGWREWDIPWVDLIIAGSPCQGFSFAGKQLAFDDPRSALFFEFVAILKKYREINPNVKFMLENVKMKKEHLQVITDMLGVEPEFINSALVSAHYRQRFYWANWKFGQPEDRGIRLQDVILDGFADRKKSYCVDANYWKGGNLTNYYKRSRRQLIFSKPHNLDKAYFKCEGYYPPLKDVRAGLYPPLLDNPFRKLKVVECERLQGLNDGYTSVEGVSQTECYKMLGNGWQIDTIVHIFDHGGFPKSDET